MKIGFDAKRAYRNTSGLGNYSRTIVEILAEYYPQNEYLLYTPKTNKVFPFKTDTQKIISPKGFFFKKLHFLWRSYIISKLLKKDAVDVYHGLSHELPNGIEKTNTKSIVTVHDLIFMRFPHLFKKMDVAIYTKKIKYACEVADRVVAISQQTKDDIVELLNVDENKIDIVYQGCNKQFYETATQEQKDKVRDKYNLPEEYLLIVGTIEERKNLLLLLKALNILKLDIPLVVIGRKTEYYEKVENYIQENGMQNKVLFYHNADFVDFAPIYQMAKMFIYPSIYEGFGIPILEALNSKIPVITSKGSCFSETGGEHCLYVDSSNEHELAETITRVLNDAELQKNMVENSYQHALKFRDEEVAKNLINLYKSVLS
jgi:glycosyltransferase involved in cell wall biosynthesis